MLYQNVPLYPQEAEFLLKLEQLIKNPIYESTRHHFIGGFMAEGGHVIMLGLDHKYMPQIPNDIANLQFLN